MVGGQRSEAGEPPDLKLGQIVDVGVAKLDGAGHDRCALEQPAPAGDRQEPATAAFVLGLDGRPAIAVAGGRRQRRVAPGDAEVRAGDRQLGVVEDRGEEGPGPIELRKSDHRWLAHVPLDGLDRRSEPEPARQLDPRLGPGKTPWDRPESVERIEVGSGVGGCCRYGRGGGRRFGRDGAAAAAA